MTNSVIESLMDHRSLRRFKEQPVPEEVLETIIKAGTRAPSAGNLQNYSFIIIDDEEIKKKLEAMDGFNKISKAPVIIVAVVDTYRIQRWFKINNSKDYSLNQSSTFFISLWDALIALHNVTIAAESMGLGGYYVGNIQEYEVKDILNLPPNTFPAAMYCLGYPEELSKLRERLPIEAVVHRNTYKIFTDEEINSIYLREDTIWKNSSQRSKDNYSKEEIYSAADFYARRKYSKDFSQIRSEKIDKNLQGYKESNETY